LLYHVGKWPLNPANSKDGQLLAYENQLEHLDIKGLTMLCNLRLCRGEDLFAAGDTTRAQKEFQTATELASHSGEASLHNSLGIFFRRARQPKLAEMEYAKALKSWHLTANERANIYTNLGNLKKDKGMFDEAIGFYRQAIDLNAHHTDAKYNLALVQAYQGVSRGEYKDAVDGFESALSYPEADPKLIFNLAILYDQKLADTVRAIQNYSRFAKIMPSLPESQMALRRIKELSP
jgi:tetratricopeptide (TPR) repeat protein